MQTIATLANVIEKRLLDVHELKKMTPAELQALAHEIRQEIISNLSKTGGHLASNLGVVEITLGLHYVFDSPRDKILWDVGHQSYVHKMLTGRQDRFASLRQYKGLSGFINPLESEHDAFLAGHSSTSVSLAVGMAVARDHLKQNHKVIALIGDGGLTGGMALEAINHLGHIQKDVLIILNDNEMSISENLGGFSQYMKRIKETFFYKDIKQQLDLIEDRLDRAHLTPAVWELILSVKKQAKERFDTPGIVFEKLGINYTGPIDGHDVPAVIEALEKVKEKSSPQIIHMITQKGKGYLPAENDAIKYHGVAAFSLEPALTEKVEPAQPSKQKAKTYSEVFTQALIEIAELEPNMVAITPATAEGSGLVKFGKVYPDRFFDVAICEQHAVTMAAGMAKTGLKPIVSIYSTFLQRAMDQVIHDVAILNLPVVFGIDRGGLVEDGETHQGVFDIAFLRSIPNFTVLAPRNATELRNMLFTALKMSTGPVAIRFPRDKAVEADLTDNTDFRCLDLAKWEIIYQNQPRKNETSQSEIKQVEARQVEVTQDETRNLNAGLAGNEGTAKRRVLILAYGAMVETARQALDLLRQSDLCVTLVNARSAKPLDSNMLEQLIQDTTLSIVTMEEGCLIGGFGAAVLEWAAKHRANNRGIRQAEIHCLGVPDHFVEHGSRSILLEENGLSPDKVAKFILFSSTIR